MSIGEPTREVVSGATAYVIVPSTYTFTQHGAKLRETAQMTFVMDRTAAGWRIAAWTWTGQAGVPLP